jgi:hypothetical protein
MFAPPEIYRVDDLRVDVAGASVTSRWFSSCATLGG